MNTTFVCSNCCSGVVLTCEFRHRFVASKKFSDCGSELLRLAKGGSAKVDVHQVRGQTRWTQVDGERGRVKTEILGGCPLWKIP